MLTVAVRTQLLEGADNLFNLLKLTDYYMVSTDYILGRTNNRKPYDIK